MSAPSKGALQHAVETDTTSGEREVDVVELVFAQLDFLSDLEQACPGGRAVGVFSEEEAAGHGFPAATAETGGVTASSVDTPTPIGVQ
eukprot:2479075-Pyramimonas_sp.AAC.1